MFIDPGYTHYRQLFSFFIYFPKQLHSRMGMTSSSIPWPHPSHFAACQPFPGTFFCFSLTTGNGHPNPATFSARR